MTTSQEKTLTKIIEKYDFNKKQYEELEDKNVNWGWVVSIKNDIVEVRENTKTLQALEKLGYIKIVKHNNYGYLNTDYVKLIKRG